jgi:hypothetical protein
MVVRLWLGENTFSIFRSSVLSVLHGQGEGDGLGRGDLHSKKRSLNPKHSTAISTLHCTVIRRPPGNVSMWGSTMPPGGAEAGPEKERKKEKKK